VLCGGLGGARLARALARAGWADKTTFITNVGDDWRVGDVLVQPDTDAVFYALSGRFDYNRGWGVLNDRFSGPREDEPFWFNLGDADRRHHEARQALLDRGARLADAVRQLAADAGLPSRIVPVTSQPVPTRVRTDEGWLAFQEWLVREHGKPAVLEVAWPDAVTANAAPEAVTAIAEADVAVIASSSPVASIAAMLAIPRIRDAVVARSGPTVVLSPVVAGRPPVAERDVRRAAAREALLRAVGLAHHPVVMAHHYRQLATRFVLDPADARYAADVAVQGVEPAIAPLLDQDRASTGRLVRAIVGGSR
jgi:LPPG:FO 2-phospho-L-lactate transferase